MPDSLSQPRPVILLTTAIAQRNSSLFREDSLTGRNYSEGVVAAGGLPVMVAALDPALAAAYARHADALLLTGGGDLDPALYGQLPAQHLGAVDQRRDDFEIALYRAFRAAGKPVLGVCRGIQVINVAEGGSLHQHLPDVRGTGQHGQHDMRGAPLHPVRLEPGSRLAGAFGSLEIKTNSYHHQAVDRLGANLKVVARAADGTVEAVEGTTGAPVIAVQWHPEMCFKEFPEHHAPFRLLLEAVRGAVHA